jgi:hypothetical protein
LAWAIEALEIRRLLHHQIDATFVPTAPTDPTLGQWVLAKGAQADQSNEPAEAPPAGFVPGTAIPAAALPGMPQLHSDLNAHAAIYLDFNGDAASVTPYDVDGDPTTFNATEAATITSAWQAISTYFAPFDVDVTTVKPATAMPTAWGMIGNSISGGYSYVGVFPDVQKFGGPASFNESSDARGRTSGMAHEYGHNFGLSHQSDYNNLGVKINEYSSGYDSTHGPIMGVDFAQSVHKWFIGHPSGSNSSLQDDVAIIANAIKTATGIGDGFRADDYGNTIATATPLTANASGVDSATGIIERMTDVDAFSFSSTGGRTWVDVNPVGPSGLAPKVEIYDAAGNLIGAKDDTDQRNGTNNDENFPVDLPGAGTYYILVKSHGDYGDIGQYTVTARPLPAGWSSQDVGSPSLTGSSSYDPGSDTYTVSGAGSDIWGTSDQFQFAYQTLQGDGSITARVVSLTNTAASAKAGVMIRDTLNGNSRDALLNINPPSRGLEYIYRTATGGSAAETQVAGLVAPYWVRLTRTGNSFLAERSSDGVNWITVGTQTITMGSTVYIGLAVSSVNTGALNSATFDNVTFTGNINPAPTYNTLAAPTGLTVTPGTGTGLTLNWSDEIGETGFAIDRSIDGTTWSQIATVGATVTTYNDNGLFGSMRYFYRIAALDSTGRSAPSAEVSALNRPNAPFGLTYESISTSQIVINWRDVSGDTGYRVERSSDGGTTWTTIATVGTNVPSTIASGLAVGTQYQFRVTALSPQGDSPISSVMTASTRLAAATGQGFTTISPGSMTIHWVAVTGATGYRVERSTDGSTFTSLATLGATAISYTDNTVTPLGEYYYRVIGTNSLTESVAPTPIFAADTTTALPPSPWQSQDIGSPAGAGATGYSAGTFTMVANGNDIWNTSDQFRFTYMPLIGNGQIIARVNTLENTDANAKAGVMIRETLAANSRDVLVSMSATNGLQLLYRGSIGGSAAQSGASVTGAAPYWVKLVRSGNTFTGYTSPDGVTWTQIGTSLTIAMSSNAYIGLAVTSHTTTTLNTAKFDSVSVGNNAPTVFTAAAATPNPVPAGQTTANLTVVGADDHGESNLTYTWAATAFPSGGSVNFSANATNAAKSAVATFSAPGNYTLTCTITDAMGLSTTSSVAVTVTPSTPAATVVGRWLFYNNSFYDGNDPNAAPSDDGAIATDKSALLPGQIATGANYSAYLHGITGIMIDVQGLPANFLPRANDFTFKIGNDNAPAAWATAPTLSGITVRPGAGINGSDRITITWADDSILNSWLQVTVNAGTHTTLATPDTFYFGNLVGDANGNGQVTVADVAMAKSLEGQAAVITTPVDFNENGQITVADVAIAKANEGNTLTLIAPPAPAPAPAPAPTPAAAPLAVSVSAAKPTEPSASPTTKSRLLFSVARIPPTFFSLAEPLRKRLGVFD